MIKCTMCPTEFSAEHFRDRHESTVHPVAILDRTLSRKLRDASIVAVNTAASKQWKQDAKALGIQIAQTCMEFTPDEFWRRGLAKPQEGRALGPIMLWLAANGYIEKTDRVRNTEQIRSHAAPVSIWRSKTYRDPAKT